jgi:hypothetical protein
MLPPPNRVCAEGLALVRWAGLVKLSAAAHAASRQRRIRRANGRNERARSIELGVIVDVAQGALFT